jgi:hypothetical protein
VICRDSNRLTFQRVFHGFGIPLAEPNLVLVGA